MTDEFNLPNLEEAVEEMKKHAKGPVVFTREMLKDCYIIEQGFTPREEFENIIKTQLQKIKEAIGEESK